MRYRHVALFVGDDLRGAEAYYARLFDMEVVLREGLLGPPGPDGEAWGQLPHDRTWDDAERAGVEIDMVALQRGDVILPLFAAEPSGERFYAIGLLMDADAVAAVGDRLDDETLEDHRDGWLAFVDRYGVRWQLSATFPFVGAGDGAGIWLEV
jgi:catechol 2,3-dioxygenase-like lactoylglutathione lyase family enzyme